MNTQRVRNAIFTLLNHPDQLNPGSAADLHLALWTENPFYQGAVSEILRHAIAEKIKDYTK